MRSYRSWWSRRSWRWRGRRWIDEEGALDATDIVCQNGIPSNLGEQLLAVDAQRLALRLLIQRQKIVNKMSF